MMAVPVNGNIAGAQRLDTATLRYEVECVDGRIEKRSDEEAK